MEYFETIIWYGDNEPHFAEGEGIISYLAQQDKKMILSSVSLMNPNNDSLYQFLPIDTVTHYNILRVMPGTEIISLADDMNHLQVDKLLSYVNGFEVNPSAGEALYRLPEGDRYWEGTPVIALRTPKENPSLYFFNFYLHKTQADKTYEMLNKILGSKK